MPLLSAQTRPSASLVALRYGFSEAAFHQMGRRGLSIDDFVEVVYTLAQFVLHSFPFGGCMGKVSSALLGSIVGGFAAVAAIMFWFGWGLPGSGQVAHVDPTRADYVDLLLTVVTIFLGAIGLAVTVGALVIGLVALKTLREIKAEAATEAKAAAAVKISETMAAGLGHTILSEMAQRGELDEVLERVAMRMQSGGPEPDAGDQA
jgi:uncharacterized membrane protein